MVQFISALTPQEVVRSSLKHYPQVIQGLLSVEESENKLRESRGAFDARLSGEGDIRSKGYYGGDFYRAQIEKPIPYLNSKIYGGARQGFGDFPIYEGKSETLSEGENFVGLSLSLLRNSLIDLNRFKIRNEEQNLQIAQAELLQIKIQSQTLALKAYWNWVVKGKKLKVYREILELAEQRATQIERRIKVGDLARIYKTENLQYIRKREAQVKQSELDFNTAAFYLSLFYRNEQGQTISVNNFSLPELPSATTIKPLLFAETLYSMALERNLNIRKLQSEKEQAELGVRMGRNEMTPQLDVNLEWNRDQGVGPTRLTGTENRIMLKMEIPIEFNRGLGRKRASEAQRDNVESQIALEKDKLKALVNSLITELNSFASIYNLSREEVEFARTLSKAEYRKFTQGASDLILVNLREENYGEAQVKNLDALLSYHLSNAEIQQVKVELLEK